MNIIVRQSVAPIYICRRFLVLGFIAWYFNRGVSKLLVSQEESFRQQKASCWYLADYFIFVDDVEERKATRQESCLDIPG